MEKYNPRRREAFPTIEPMPDISQLPLLGDSTRINTERFAPERAIKIVGPVL